MNEPIVSISLKEIEELKAKVNSQANRICELEAKKDVTLHIDADVLDWGNSKRAFDSRCRIYANWT